jgi:DNA-binding SARP family transcriptional activator
VYEDWSEPPRQRVHQFLRGALLPLVESPSIAAATRVRIGTAVVALDDFDELAHVALGRALAESGRRVAGLNLVRRLAARLEDEFSEPPPDGLANAISELRQKAPVT